MSLLSQFGLNNVIVTFQNVFKNQSFRSVNISRSQKIIVLSVTASVALLGVLARYLRRRRTAPSGNFRKALRNQIKDGNQGINSPNGDVLSQASSRRSGSPSIRSTHRKGSVLSDRLSAASVPLSLGAGDGTSLTPQQLGTMGMEALETSINYWEDALSSYNYKTSGQPLALTCEEEAEFSKQLEILLEAAYHLQEQCELLFLDQRSVLFRADSSVRDADFDGRSGYISSAESFVSCQDEIADLRDFENFADAFADVENLPLYQSALKQFENGGIPYRCLRTEMVHCTSDVEYLGKLHCIRLAFQHLFKDHNTWIWFSDSGRQVLTNLLLYADKDPKDFLIAYEEMLMFVQDKTSWEDVEEELSVKGVKAMTFYDVVLDYILMDAFEDLDAPPSSVTAVVQNRWLSNGFKESALTTAVWSVLKAKRRMLKFPNGFMAHFYAISEQMSPLMAWGFLGPDESLQEICFYFKEQVMNFLMDSFNFEKTRYTTIEELSTDIMSHIRLRVENISRRLASRSSL
uniref:Mitoguardin n=1 Tax=Clastoptera arizonana TaxID=38151 RepID=A0A1B6CGB2_9HEMI